VILDRNLLLALVAGFDTKRSSTGGTGERINNFSSAITVALFEVDMLLVSGSCSEIRSIRSLHSTHQSTHLQQ
jgi:hypothetical protein